MFTQVIKPFRSGKSKGVNETNIKLFTLRLSNVLNCYDAYSLWDHRYGSQKEIYEDSSGRNDFRLKKSLEIYRRIVNTSVDGKWMEKTEKVFTDVILWIPEAVWQDDIEVGATNISMLADKLAQYHTQDFKNDFFSGKKPAYVVMPDASLNQGEVRLQFGMGVYVPDFDEDPVAQVEIKMKGQPQWHPLQQWAFWKDGRLSSRPPGIYQQQQGIIIGPDSESAAVKVEENPGHFPWFSHARGAVFINYALKTSNYVFGDGKHISRQSEIDSQDDHTGQGVFKFHSLDAETDTASETLLIRITPFHAAGPSEEPEARAKEQKKTCGSGDEFFRKGGQGQQDTIPLQEEPAAFETILIGPDSVSQETKMPFMDVPHMFLEGYALPRIDKFRIPGLNRWEIWLGNDGQVTMPPFRSKAGAEEEHKDSVAVSGSTDTNGLYFIAHGGGHRELIQSFPKRLSMENGCSYEVDALPENNYYSGLLQLPEPDRYFVIEDQEMVLGRGEFVDIRMDLLHYPEFLCWEKGRESNTAHMGLLNLSREHAKLRRDENGCLEVTNISRTSPLFILREDDTLDMIEKDTSKTVVMKPGERLLMGCCLLRYENETVEKNDSVFSLKQFIETDRFRSRFDRFSNRHDISEHEQALVKAMGVVIENPGLLDDIFSISPEDYIRTLDTIESFLMESGADDKDIERIKNAKINYLNRFK